MENLTREEALQAMMAGNVVRNTLYSKDEYLFINEEGDFETEEGYVHGGIYDEFWSKYQIFPDGWSITEDAGGMTKTDIIDDSMVFTFQNTRSKSAIDINHNHNFTHKSKFHK